MALTQMLSSFAISVAANIVTSLFARNGTEKEIRAAFQEAIEKWCPNEDIRRFREPAINKFVEDYIKDPLLNPLTLTEEMKEFLSCFEKCIAAHEAAFNYLSAIKEKGYYSEVMATLQIVNRKLDTISKKLDEVNPRHEQLHWDAVVQINTILWDVVEEPLNVFLYGLLSAFDGDIFATADVKDDGTIEIKIDEDSRLMEDEDGDSYRPKFHDFEYNWEKERKPGWTEIEPDLDFWNMFRGSYIAAFQLMRIDFYEGIDQLQGYIDRTSINDQLTIDEKRLLSEIIADMRALQSVIEDHHDIFTHVEEAHFKNMEVKLLESFEEHGKRIGHYAIWYNDGEYSELITDTLAPVELEKILLDVMMITPDYYYKLTGYMGELFRNVVQWWSMTSKV